jgi:hypothetical protein
VKSTRDRFERMNVQRIEPAAMEDASQGDEFSRRKLVMRISQVLLFVAATSQAAWCSPGGVLEKVTRIQVDQTVVEHPEKVDSSVAANLVRFNLRAAVKDAHFDEGESATRAHFVLEEFSSESAAKRLMNLGSGRTTSTVDGKLVIQDASGKELASVKIHVHGSVAFTAGDGRDPRTRATSDLEQRLLQEIERLK